MSRCALFSYFMKSWMLSRMLKDNSDCLYATIIVRLWMNTNHFSVSEDWMCKTKQRYVIFVGSCLISCSSASPAIDTYSLKCMCKVGGEGVEDPKACQKVCEHSWNMHQRPRDPTVCILVGYNLQRIAVTGEQNIFL